MLTFFVLRTGLFALGMALNHWVGSAIVKRVVAPYAAKLTGEDLGLPTAGKTIGRLERFLILLFVVTDSVAAVGFLLTAKSVFRFGDLKDVDTQRKTEYYLVGTLASFTFALVVGFLVKLAMTYGFALSL